MGSRPTYIRTVLIGGMALAMGSAMTLAAGPATAGSKANSDPVTSVTVKYACKATPPIGGPQELTFEVPVMATAPATVRSGESLTVTVVPQPMRVPAEIGSVNAWLAWFLGVKSETPGTYAYRLKELNNLKLKATIPGNSTFNTVTLSGGSNLGGPPSVRREGSHVVLDVPGPLAGGSTFQLPRIDIGLTAGTQGDIVATVSGTSHDDPGLTFTAVVDVLGGINVPVACYPSPRVSLTTTTIEAASATQDAKAILADQS